MTRLRLSKAALAEEARRLAGYRRVLPALDLKRRQIAAAAAEARGALAAARDEAAAIEASVGERLPMLSVATIALDGLVAVRAVDIGERNVAGVRIPVFAGADVAVAEYGAMGTPHWTDACVDAVKAAAEARLALAVAVRQVEVLEAAARKIVQKVNLFEKVLIPRTAARIARIRIALDDAEMAGVVRSKIAKRKRAEAAA